MELLRGNGKLNEKDRERVKMLMEMSVGSTFLQARKDKNNKKEDSKKEVEEVKKEDVSNADTTTDAAIGVKRKDRQTGDDDAQKKKPKIKTGNPITKTDNTDNSTKTDNSKKGRVQTKGRVQINSATKKAKKE